MNTLRELRKHLTTSLWPLSSMRTSALMMWRCRKTSTTSMPLLQSSPGSFQLEMRQRDSRPSSARLTPSLMLSLTRVMKMTPRLLPYSKLLNGLRESTTHFPKILSKNFSTSMTKMAAELSIRMSSNNFVKNLEDLLLMMSSTKLSKIWILTKMELLTFQNSRDGGSLALKATVEPKDP